MATADPNPTRIGNIIHSLTLPMLPAISGKPMQFFAVTFGTVPADLIDKYGLEMVESRADEFSYVDIGAGVPDGPEY